MTGILELDVPRSQWGQFQQSCADAGETIDRGANRSADTENTTDAKIRIGLTVVGGDRLQARESTRIRVEVPDVDRATADAQAMAAAARGRVVDATVANEHDRGQARIVMDVPLNNSSDVIRQLRQMGIVRGIDASRNSEAPSGAMAHAVVSVEFVTADAIVADTRRPRRKHPQRSRDGRQGLDVQLAIHRGRPVPDRPVGVDRLGGVETVETAEPKPAVT